MNKLLITACSLALLVNVGCNKQSQTNSISDNNYASSATSKELIYKVGDRVFFDLNSSSISDDAKLVLKRQINFMKDHPNLKFVIEGHCDKRGTTDYNMGLGERRANSIKKYLVSNGIDADRIVVVSFGKEKIAVLGDTEEIHKQNRRSVVVIR